MLSPSRRRRHDPAVAATPFSPTPSHGREKQTGLTLPTDSSILDRLPDDIIGLILGLILGNQLGNLPPTTLVEFACTCKAAAALALPILYSSILVPSLPAIAQLYTVLVAKPDLAQHVCSLTASQYLVEIGQFMLVGDTLGDPGKVQLGSSIVSVDKVQERCGTKLLNMLPMAWFTRIARICPNLVSVDISRVPDLDMALPCLTFGVLDLARILRARGGRFVSSSKAPFSAVVVNDYAIGTLWNGFARGVCYVTAMDWGRKQIDMTGDVETIFEKGHVALVPFSDLTCTSLDEQNKWTIRRAEISTEVGRAATVGTPDQAWAHLGIRANGADRVFDLSQPNQITATVAFITNNLGQCRSMLERRRISVTSQCSQVMWVGPDPQISFMLAGQVQYAASQVLQFVSHGPWVALTEFVASNSMFLTTQNAPTLLAQMADAMPNLASLELRNMRAPMDFVLTNLDCLIRRPAHRGKLLQSVYLSVVTLHRSDPPLSTAAYSLAAGIDTTARTKLDSTRPTRNHLRSLSLEVEGRGPHDLAHYECPAVAIHPGLLHGIERLYFKLVKLAVMPPHLAHATAPSFLPLSAFTLGPKVTHRTPLTLEHVTLPALTRLETCTHSLAPLATRDPHPPYRMPAALPSAPNLAHLLLISTDTRHLSFFAPHVLPTLLRYPRLVRARIGYAELAEVDLQVIVRHVLSRPRALGARLRNLIVDNLNADQVDRNGDPGMRGQLVSMPHLVDLYDAFPQVCRGKAKVDFSRTSVELDAGAMAEAGAAAGAGAGTTRYRDGSRVKRDQCPKCGLVVDMFGAGQMDVLAGMLGGFGMMPGMEEAMRQMGLGGSGALVMCPMCSPRESSRVGRYGSWGLGMGRAHGDGKGEVSLWCREGTRDERVI